METKSIPANVLSVIRAAASAFNVTESDILSRSQERPASEARTAAYLILGDPNRGDRQMSFPDIGKHFDRTRESIGKAYRAGRGLVAVDPRFATKVLTALNTVSLKSS